MRITTDTHRVQLYCFEPLTDSSITLYASIHVLAHGRLRLHYQLHDPHHHVLWPDPAPLPMQNDFLWQHTCMEAFIQPVERNAYTELNLSPRHQWNAYRFTDYRQPKNMPPLHETRLKLEQFEVQHHQLSAVIDLSGVYPLQAELRISLAAILAHPLGRESFWAAQHSGESADFHRADDRVLALSLLP